MRSTLNDSEFPSPLARRAPPYPDEDILSMLRRSVSRMGYPDFRWLLRPEGKRWDIEEKAVRLLSEKRDYPNLENLLLLSQEELHSHTLHRFAPLLEDGEGFQRSPGHESASTNLPQLSSRLQETYFLPIRSIRVCPLCLQEQECYDRLYWRMQLIVHCPQHRLRLLEKCPSCEAPLVAD